MSIPDLAQLDAIILAGGLGTRLRPVVADRQKAFAPVGEQPFAARLLDQLKRAGVRRVVFALGHLADSALPWIARWRAEYGLDLIESIEPAALGTGGAVRLALERTRSARLLVLNGDSFVDADLAAFCAAHVRSGLPLSLCAVRVPDASRFGALELDDSGSRVLAFHEKDPAARGPAWINAGIYLIERPVLAAFDAGRPFSLERDLFPQQVRHGLGAFPQEKPFIDIGTPESYAAGPRFFAAAP